jgi:hypothetical protein
MATSAYMIGRADLVSALERSNHAHRDAREARPPTLENASAMLTSGREGVRGPVVAVRSMPHHGHGQFDAHAGWGIFDRWMQPYRWRSARRCHEQPPTVWPVYDTCHRQRMPTATGLTM